MGIAIVITSGKGGTGKTSVTCGLASVLAQMGKKVLCIDMDIGLRCLDLALGLSDRVVMDFTDVITGRCTLRRAVVEHPEIRGLFLLTAPTHITQGEITAAQMDALMWDVRSYFDYCFIDCPAGIGSGFRLASCAADRAIIVSTTEPTSLRDAQHTVQELRIMGKNQIHLVINKMSKKLLRQLHTTIDDAMDTAGLPLLGIIPDDPKVSIFSGRGQPVVLHEINGAARAYDCIARRIMGQHIRLQHF